MGLNIDEFSGEYEYLSNFFQCPVYYEGIIYPTSENAFQAAKIKIPGDGAYTNKLRYEAGFTCVSPSEAKKIGRSVSLRDDWEDVKDNVMLQVVRNKFSQTPILGSWLKETYPKLIIEGNYWHDNYWGQCKCNRCTRYKGRNTLGKILMQVREELR